MPTIFPVPMQFSFNYLYFNALYFNGFHLSTAGSFIMPFLFNYIKEATNSLPAVVCVPDSCVFFALPVGLCLSYCLTQVFHIVTHKIIFLFYTVTLKQLYKLKNGCIGTEHTLFIEPICRFDLRGGCVLGEADF
jgi:hypothetical protein